jgi:RNA methyltransferase, TrmH family
MEITMIVTLLVPIIGRRSNCRGNSLGSLRGISHTVWGSNQMQIETITSRDNRWLKKFRVALGGSGPVAGDPLGVEGPKLVEGALSAELSAEALLVTEVGERHLERILRAAGASETGIPRSRIFRTTVKLFAGLSGTENPQGVAGLFQQPAWVFEDILRGIPERDTTFYYSNSPLAVVLTEIQDPGNVGTIIRSAEAFGATGVIATRGSADPWSPKALRASAGSALRLPVLRGMAIPTLLAELRAAGVKIYAATARGESVSLLPSGAFQGPSAIFIGNEGAGLPAEVEHVADAKISIPMNDAVESLNAGVAASLLLYEIARNRKQ